jgi:hypothetical protein
MIRNDEEEEAVSAERGERDFDPVAFLKQRKARATYEEGGWLHRATHDGPPYAGFCDPVAGGTVSLFSDMGTQAQLDRLADLFYQTAVTHWLTVAEIHQMAMTAIHGADALDDDFDFMEEMAQRIAEARRDAQRLRQLREEGGGSLEEIVQIMQRSRDGLLWQMMRVDPARAEKIGAALDASARRIRKMVREHNRAVRRERARGKRN